MERLGPYEILEHLGSGGAGSICRARWTGAAGFEKTVALKRLLPEFAQNAEAVQALIDEAKLGARLTHGNIAQVLRLEQWDDEWIVVLEYVAGVDLYRLAQVLRQHERRLPFEEIVHLGREVLQALHFLHGAKASDGRSLQLVHCDVAPANVMVSLQGEVKLIDFGSARGPSLSELEGSVPGGKLRYRSPEQMRGDGFDHRSDLYSLAVMLWELLAGERIYESMSLEEIIDSISAGIVPDLRHHRPDTPAPLQDLLRRALSPDRQARFGNAAEFLGALEDTHLCPEPARAQFALGELARASRIRKATLEIVPQSEASLEDALDAELG